MGHFEKHQKADSKRIANEIYRLLNDYNNYVDKKRSYKNYDLIESKESFADKLEQRLSEVKMLNRKNVNACCSLVQHLPKDYTTGFVNMPLENDPDYGYWECDEEKGKEFFNEVLNYMKQEFGEENIMSAVVHMDETTPHIHIQFVPVVKDKKTGIEKVSAKECLNKFKLQSYHSGLDKHLKQNLEWYHGGVLNGKGKGGISNSEYKAHIKAIKEVDKIIDEVNLLTKEIEEVQILDTKALEEYEFKEKGLIHKEKQYLLTEDELKKLINNTELAERFQKLDKVIKKAEEISAALDDSELFKKMRQLEQKHINLRNEYNKLGLQNTLLEKANDEKVSVISDNNRKIKELKQKNQINVNSFCKMIDSLDTDQKEQLFVKLFKHELDLSDSDHEDLRRIMDLQYNHGQLSHDTDRAYSNARYEMQRENYYDLEL